MNEFKEIYQSQVKNNAKAFAQALNANNIPVEGDPSEGYTATHQVLIRVDGFGNGMELARRLEDNNIVCNYQALPYDETFLKPSGIRLGVQEMTRFGMKAEDFDTLAGLMAEVLIHNKNVKEEVKQYRQNFLKMQYCLPAEEAVPLVAQVWRSIFSHKEDVDFFVDNLKL
jgi:glycine/serine hydroxymethyltransferase